MAETFLLRQTIEMYHKRLQIRKLHESKEPSTFQWFSIHFEIKVSGNQNTQGPQVSVSALAAIKATTLSGQQEIEIP